MRFEEVFMRQMNTDLWSHLAATDKTVVLYGMGNGADKIVKICQEKEIAVSDFFASDGFVRGQIFHGKRVLSWSETKEKYGVQNLIVLLSFGSSRPDVLETILRVASEAELYAPDVPAFGDGVIDGAFFQAHEAELAEVRSLFEDEESRLILDEVLAYKRTGVISHLMRAVSDPDEVMRRLICPDQIKTSVDLGAYTGDTVRELLDASKGALENIYALEPDARNFKKLSAYAEQETRARVHPYCLGAWSGRETLCFDGSGNRNASMEVNRSQSLADRKIKVSFVEGEAIDNLLGDVSVDYIKYDVEGSEREALLGSVETIKRSYPTLLVSLYHRNEDIFALPLLVRTLFPEYKGFYLRRFRGVPAWDLNLYVTRKKRSL